MRLESNVIDLASEDLICNFGYFAAGAERFSITPAPDGVVGSPVYTVEVSNDGDNWFQFGDPDYPIDKYLIVVDQFNFQRIRISVKSNLSIGFLRFILFGRD